MVFVNYPRITSSICETNFVSKKLPIYPGNFPQVLVNILSGPQTRKREIIHTVSAVRCCVLSTSLKVKLGLKEDW